MHDELGELLREELLQCGKLGLLSIGAGGRDARRLLQGGEALEHLGALGHGVGLRLELVQLGVELAAGLCERGMHACK